MKINNDRQVTWGKMLTSVTALRLTTQARGRARPSDESNAEGEERKRSENSKIKKIELMSLNLATTHSPQITLSYGPAPHTDKNKGAKVTRKRNSVHLRITLDTSPHLISYSSPLPIERPHEVIHELPQYSFTKVQSRARFSNC